MTLRKISSKEFQKILFSHRLWVSYHPDGTKAILTGVDFRNASLEGINLRGVDLSCADLSGADLRGTDLRNANLYSTNLQGANLQGTNFRHADLRHVSLQDAKLRNAGLQKTDLRSALCDAGIQEAWSLRDSLWLRSDIPWWLGHPDQKHIVLCEV